MSREPIAQAPKLRRSHEADRDGLITDERVRADRYASTDQHDDGEVRALLQGSDSLFLFPSFFLSFFFHLSQRLTDFSRSSPQKVARARYTRCLSRASFRKREACEQNTRVRRRN